MSKTPDYNMILVAILGCKSKSGLLPIAVYTGIMLLFFPLVSTAQIPEPEAINYLEESNKIYRSNIRSVLFHREGFELSPPLMDINRNEKLRLSFDDLEADGKVFTYTIIHCDASWRPSEIPAHQYIRGFSEEIIYDHTYSQNTLVPYTHYTFTFPDESLKPALPGNYILKVYLDHPDSIYFTRRFMVFDQRIEISAQVNQSKIIEERKSKQKVDFEINTPQYRISDPYRDLEITIIQNGRWDNRIQDIKPRLIVGNKLNYSHDYENVFDGGNEFRTLDIKSLNYYTENIANISRERDGYQVTLHPDKKRPFQVYKSERDINGRMIIKTEDRRESSTEAEYVHVNFFLPYSPPIIDGHIYIFGALTDWSYSPENRMNYDFRRNGYTKTILLKQGYYNYHYMAYFEHSNWGDVSFIEGNHWETENDYTILVYYREPGGLFDQLIGVAQINSVNP